jgi:hypothetical protein
MDEASMETMMDCLPAGVLEKVKPEFQGMNLKGSSTEGKTGGRDMSIAGPLQGHAPNEKKKDWYAVINGKGGINSIFPEWIGGATPYITGTRGALTKKFDSFDSAWEHVSSHLAIEEALKQAEEDEIRKRMKASLLTT